MICEPPWFDAPRDDKPYVMPVTTASLTAQKESFYERMRDLLIETQKVNPGYEWAIRREKLLAEMNSFNTRCRSNA